MRAAGPEAGTPTLDELMHAAGQCWQPCPSLMSRPLGAVTEGALWPAGPVFDLLFEAAKATSDSWQEEARQHVDGVKSAPPSRGRHKGPSAAPAERGAAPRRRRRKGPSRAAAALGARASRSPRK